MQKSGFIEWLIPLLIVLAAGSGALIYKQVTKAPDDNPIEEIAEEIIKKETGADVDLSPSTPEKMA